MKIILVTNACVIQPMPAALNTKMGGEGDSETIWEFCFAPLELMYCSSGSEPPSIVRETRMSQMSSGYMTYIKYDVQIADVQIARTNNDKV